MGEDIKKIHVSRKKLLQETNKGWLSLEDNLKLILQGVMGAYRGEFNTDILTAENFKSNNIITKEKTTQTVLVKIKLKECHRWVKKWENYLEIIFSKGLYPKQKLPQVEKFPDFQEVKNSIAQFAQKGSGGTDE